MAFDGDDCNDDDPGVHPGATEDWASEIDFDCDGNPDDQDLDGVPFVDDCDDLEPDIGATREWHIDADGDGFGGDGTVIGDCDPEPGQLSEGNDCDDTDPGIGTERRYYVDEDGDGFGIGDAIWDCDLGAGYATADGDCDDTDEQAFPGALWYVDRDSDTWGDPATALESCLPIAGRIAEGEDCDDTDEFQYPGAREILFDYIDSDCAGDTDFDRDGDGYPDPVPTWFADWPAEYGCGPSPTLRQVGAGLDYATIQEAIDDAQPCDTIEVHDGIYDDIVIQPNPSGTNTRAGLVVVAADGATPTIVGGKSLEPAVTVASVGIVLAGLTVQDAPIGVIAGGVTVLDRMVVQDTLFAVESSDYLIVMGSRFERAAAAIGNAGPTVVTETDFVDIVGVAGVVDVAVPRDGVLADQPSDVYFDSVRFERCTGGIFPVLHIDAEVINLVDVHWDEPGSAALRTDAQVLLADGLSIEAGASYGDHTIQVVGVPAIIPDGPGMWVPSTYANVQNVFVRGHLWVPARIPAFFAVDNVDAIEISNVVLRGNILYAPDEGYLERPPVWIRALSDMDGAILSRTLHNIEVSVSDDAELGVTGIGIMAQAGLLSQVTAVGLDAALWPLVGLSSDGGPATEVPPIVTNAISWNNDSLFIDLDVPGGAIYGMPFTTRIVSNSGNCSTCLEEDPGFLRYDPAMPASSWDLRLRRDSPYYRYDEPVDEGSTCSDPASVDRQLGAYGAHVDTSIDLQERFVIEPEPGPYDDCDGDGMYDTWEWEFLALEPDLDDDGDGLDNVVEFERGTFPQVADSDSDTRPDTEEHPFDPTR